MDTKFFIDKFSGHLKDILSAKEAGAELFQATEGGKRLRPYLLYMTGQAILDGKSDESVDMILMDFAAGLECIHAYSLVHDDLPAMDDDDFRRGKPSIHKVFGEARAILCGDSLLNLAYEIFFNSALKTDCSYLKRTVEAGRAISYYAGLSGMIEGQLLDIGEIKDEAKAKLMVENKTAALFRAAGAAGAILAGADEEKQKIVDNFCLNYGIFFQLLDDRSDSRKDLEKGKSSYYNLMGAEKAENLIADYEEKCKQAISDLGADKYLSYFIDSLK